MNNSKSQAKPRTIPNSKIKIPNSDSRLIRNAQLTDMDIS